MYSTMELNLNWGLIFIMFIRHHGYFLIFVFDILLIGQYFFNFNFSSLLSFILLSLSASTYLFYQIRQYVHFQKVIFNSVVMQSSFMSFCFYLIIIIYYYLFLYCYLFTNNCLLLYLLSIILTFAATIVISNFIFSLISFRCCLFSYVQK
jgi:hypothetical protein